MMHKLPGLLVVIAFATLPALCGCENNCQQMCREFADIYEECGQSYGDSELRDCVQEYRIPDKTVLAAVCDYGMQENEEYGTTLRADMVSSADGGDICTTLDDWQRTVGSGD